MKYSIIIPTYNEEKLLPGILENICDERKKKKYDYEVIVADGGSTDNTLSIAESYADVIIKQEKHEKRTIAGGRVKGANNACGEFLLFINADVTFNVDDFFSIVENKFCGSNYVALTCAVKVDPGLMKKKDKYFSFFLNNYFQLINFIGLGMARGECQLIRRKIYEEAGGYNSNIVAGEDFELFTRIRKLGKVMYIRNFYVYESPRRYHAWGYCKILSLWFLNGISSWLFNRAVVSSWEEVR